MLVGGTISPAPAVPASTRISARLEHVQELSSRVNMLPRCKRPGKGYGMMFWWCSKKLDEEPCAGLDFFVQNYSLRTEDPATLNKSYISAIILV